MYRVSQGYRDIWQKRAISTTVNTLAIAGWLLLALILIDGLLFNCKNIINVLEAL
mgnify:CR=1 FL=1